MTNCFVRSSLESCPSEASRRVPKLSAGVEFNHSVTQRLMVTQSDTEMTPRDSELVIAAYRSGCLEMSNDRAPGNFRTQRRAALLTEACRCLEDGLLRLPTVRQVRSSLARTTGTDCIARASLASCHSEASHRVPKLSVGVM